MKKLMNLAIASGLFVDGFHSDYSLVKEFVKDHGLDGVEMILYGDYKVAEIPKELVCGHHLLYWPNWLNFWHKDKEALMKGFLSEENMRAYYGFESSHDMADYYRREFAIAKEVSAAYMVYHVSHVDFEEIFTFKHRHNSQAVMAACAELINEVFVGDGPMLLFENLNWPGLTYTDVVLTKWFMEQIDYENKGLLLDMAHLMATNPLITTDDQGINYIHEILDQLGDLVKEIKVIHLNKTLAGPYLQEDHSQRHAAFMDRKDVMEGYTMIYEHISQIDSHMPFNHPRIMEIIKRIQPEYVVYELKANNLEELSQRITEQNRFVG